jgi:hypothetical protein
MSFIATINKATCSITTFSIKTFNTMIVSILSLIITININENKMIIEA